MSMSPKRRASEAQLFEDSTSHNNKASEPATTANKSNNNTNPPKRQRVSRACDQCRTAREKCDGIQPLCFPCASQNRQCSWEEPKKKRGVQTGYIRTLELALGWIFDKIPGSEDALLSLLTHEGGQGRVLLVGQQGKESQGGAAGGKEGGGVSGVTGVGSRLHRRWRKSTVHKEIDRVLSGGDTACTRAEKPSPPGFESDSEDDVTKSSSGAAIISVPPAQISAEAQDIKVLDGINLCGQCQHHESTSQNPMIAKDPDPPPGHLSGHHDYIQGHIKLLKLPLNYWHLLDIYFAYTHCWFPILEKTLVQKTCWLYPNEGLGMSQDHRESGSHAELWAALALASYQDEASDMGEKPPDTQRRMSSEEIYNTARGLIPSEFGDFDVRHINAFLLLALINIGRQELTVAWFFIGFANRVALSLGLHLGTTAEGSRRSRHTFMGCFVLDTITSSYMDQLPHLRAEDAQSSTPSGEDDQDEWESWTPCPGFGIQQQQSRASRSPSHAVSSFTSLYGIHRILSYHAFCHGPHGAIPTSSYAQYDGPDSYLCQVQRTLSGGPNAASASSPRHQHFNGFNSFVVAGGVPPAQVPSIYVLRLAFLCSGAQLKAFGQSLPLMVLQCLEDHILNFGVGSIPPLFSIYMNTVSRQYGLDHLKPDESVRWRKAEAAVDSVWRRNSSKIGDENHQSPMSLNRHGDRFTYAQPQPTVDVPRRFADVTQQQLPTPTSYYADAPPDRSTASVISDIYRTPATTTTTTTSSTIMSYNTTDLSRPRLSTQLNPTASSGANTNTSFELLEQQQQPQHYPTLHDRLSFSSASFDYDAILDDIASLDRTDRMESDSQFMANLGFLPGTDVLSHDFIG